MTRKELAELIAKNKISEPDWLNRVDKELLRTTCEKMSDEDWNNMDNQTIELLGKYLLSPEDKQRLSYDVDDFLNKMDNSQ